MHREIAADDAAFSLCPQVRRALLEALATTVIEHAEYLGELDRAIGDGDHGLNLKRGFVAVREQIDQLARLPVDRALIELGKRLVLQVGGASGPLYGTFFMVLGAGLGSALPLTRERFVSALDGAVAGLKARGKSDVGQKTMLDVVVPVAAELHAWSADVLDRVRARAALAAAATIPMRAQRGRAAFLGERSIGHMDPGACSSRLMITAICDRLQQSGVNYRAD